MKARLFCTTIITVLFTIFCQAQTATISGKVGLGVSNLSSTAEEFEIVLKNQITNDSVVIPLTTVDYTFNNVPLGGSYIIYVNTAKNNEDYLNGVSTLDLVMITRHILGVDQFNNPYKSLAADVSEDGRVSVLDLVMLRSLILGITTALNHSWIVRLQEDITKEKIIINNLFGDLVNQNFVLIKKGDINGNPK